MPTSIDPPPADDELECGRCGAHFYYELTRCPNCGVNIYEPDENSDQNYSTSSRAPGKPRKGLGARLDGFIRRFTKKPYAVDELFGASINQAELFDNLLVKVGGDREKVERLIEFERQQYPQGNRLVWLKDAIQRWERDNRASGTG
jgi:predicted  nucleic acid-binding Zn-ribbon protein